MSHLDSRRRLDIPDEATHLKVRPVGAGPEYSVVAHWSGSRAHTVPIARTRSLDHAEVIATAVAAMIGAETGTLLR